MKINAMTERERFEAAQAHADQYYSDDPNHWNIAHNSFLDGMRAQAALAQRPLMPALPITGEQPTVTSDRQFPAQRTEQEPSAYLFRSRTHPDDVGCCEAHEFAWFQTQGHYDLTPLYAAPVLDDDALERAALEAEHWQKISTTPGHACGQYIAAAIRALKIKPTSVLDDEGMRLLREARADLWAWRQHAITTGAEDSVTGELLAAIDAYLARQKNDPSRCASD